MVTLVFRIAEINFRASLMKWPSSVFREKMADFAKMGEVTAASRHGGSLPRINSCSKTLINNPQRGLQKR